MSTQETANLVRDFMEEVWNKHNPEAADQYLAANFLDHANRTSLSGAEGMKQWIRVTNAAFDHKTIIEDQITQDDRVALRITFQVTHIGNFRGVEATGRQAATTGFRFFRVANGKIVEHWGYIDGDSLVQQFIAPEPPTKS